jgi:hypothetical protein
VNLSLIDCNKAIVYINGQKKVVEVKGNTLTISLTEGNGAFVIPYKG